MRRMQGSGLGEPDTAATPQTWGVLAYKFDARAFQRRDQFHQRIDVAANNPATRLHAPDGGDRQAAHLGKVPLV